MEEGNQCRLAKGHDEYKYRFAVDVLFLFRERRENSVLSNKRTFKQSDCREANMNVQSPKKFAGDERFSL